MYCRSSLSAILVTAISSFNLPSPPWLLFSSSLSLSVFCFCLSSSPPMEIFSTRGFGSRKRHVDSTNRTLLIAPPPPHIRAPSTFRYAYDTAFSATTPAWYHVIGAFSHISDCSTIFAGTQRRLRYGNVAACFIGDSATDEFARTEFVPYSVGERFSSIWSSLTRAASGITERVRPTPKPQNRRDQSRPIEGLSSSPHFQGAS